MQSSQNRILVAFIIVTVIFGGVYLSGRQNVTDAVGELEMEYSNFSIDRVQLIPPEVDLTLTYTVYNPSDIPLDISIDGYVYYGETMITPFTVDKQTIPTMDQGTLDAEISLNSTLIQAIGDPENEGNYSLRGTLTATGKYLGVMPVSVDLDLQEISSEE